MQPVKADIPLLLFCCTPHTSTPHAIVATTIIPGDARDTQ
jgi:hypothetical protein